MIVNRSVPGAVGRPAAKVSAQPQAARPVATAAAPTVAHENPVLRFLKHFLKPSQLWHNPAAKPPAAPTGLKVASYNIQLGGIHLAQALANLKAMNPDVICLQETSQESAQAIAKALGMNMYFSADRIYMDGLAVLSRYPITSAVERRFKDTSLDRLKVYLKGIGTHGISATEPLGARSMVHVGLKVGDRTVDVVNGHLASSGTDLRAHQLGEVASYAKKLEDRGHTVIVGGDFNTTFGFSPDGKADPKGTFATPTDTAQEYADRYGKSIDLDPGNMAGIRQLDGTLQNFWSTAAQRTVLSADGELTPEAAMAELRTGQVPVGSARYQALLRAMDGVSHLGAEKRFDSIFASKDVQMASAFIDQTHPGSDHQPVAAEVRFGRAPKP